MRWKRAGVGAIAPVAVPNDNQGLGCILRSPIRFYRDKQVPNVNS
ncbi:hypothetical protein [Oscillatoria acuminata]|nr:hypothetical protein [Oscillatoria acuminata]